jgi:glycosyltransferase involved in cell wall biosynthesis
MRSPAVGRCRCNLKIWPVSTDGINMNLHAGRAGKVLVLGDDTMSFLAVVRSLDMPALLPAFDVFCLPSRAEGLPLSVLEAQAVGIPVVASDVGALREALCPGISRLVPAADPSALAKGITDVLTQNTSSSPRPFVIANFNWDQTVLAYRKLIGV